MKSNISSRIPGAKYSKLTDTEQMIIHMLDSFAPNTESVGWPCSYDELMKLADRAPSITGGELMATLMRIKEFKMLDFFFMINNGKFDIWVSPWSYRHQLAHTLNDHLIAQRSAAASTSEPTQAA